MLYQDLLQISKWLLIFLWIHSFFYHQDRELNPHICKKLSSQQQRSTSQFSAKTEINFFSSYDAVVTHQQCYCCIVMCPSGRRRSSYCCILLCPSGKRGSSYCCIVLCPSGKRGSSYCCIDTFVLLITTAKKLKNLSSI